MYTSQSTDINALFIKALAHLMKYGNAVEVRELKTKELHPALLSLSVPRKRVLAIPARKNNVFATVAEYVWIMAGRNDLDFLSFYLSNAGNYSDDGKTWRAGYGPRLRFWQKRDGTFVDQLAEVERILKEDIYSRRAVMVLFDPDLDFVHQSKDYPCTNWLHFLYRNGALDLKVTMRSNDILFGMSQTNIPVFSLILETMADFLGVKPGNYYHDADSLHIYENMYERADQILSSPSDFSLYNYVEPLPTAFTLPTYWHDLERLFTLEALFRREDAWKPASDNLKAHLSLFSNPFMRGLFGMLVSYALMKWGDLEKAFIALLTVPQQDFQISGLEFFWRTKVSKLDDKLQHEYEDKITEHLRLVFGHLLDHSDPSVRENGSKAITAVTEFIVHG